MSKHVETITLPLPLEAAVDVCQAALRAGNWKITNTDGRNFLVKEQFSLLSTLLSYPTRAAILLREQSPDVTRVELHGSIFGIGPLQARRVRGAVGRLRADIESAAAAAASAEA